ncbi:hypothetical protein U9M48_009846 [Paspalum notatum var. saurae]|uniref:Uncharacterized protein n=1 Tax=Paspalum notatum var. saurae TaxID=547442 RepID=A0AAQ3WFJ0_PASNO
MWSSASGGACGWSPIDDRGAGAAAALLAATTLAVPEASRHAHRRRGRAGRDAVHEWCGRAAKVHGAGGARARRRSIGGEGLGSRRRAVGEAVPPRRLDVWRRTLRDTVALLLVPNYDLATAAPFVFSRADAVESDSFCLRDVCAATCAVGRSDTRSRSSDRQTSAAIARRPRPSRALACSARCRPYVGVPRPALPAAA